MLLSHLINKNICSANTVKGCCKGVGISTKNAKVKYLLCASTNHSATDFAINASSVTDVEDEIAISALRPVFPKSCIKLFIGLPVFSYEGAYLGNLTDLSFDDFVATEFYTNRKKAYSVQNIFACNDAILLKKEQVYPLGQRIPAPVVSRFSNKSDSVVTKPYLRLAMSKGNLIKLTLSLSPFFLDLPMQHKKKKLF